MAYAQNIFTQNHKDGDSTEGQFHPSCKFLYPDCIKH